MGVLCVSTDCARIPAPTNPTITSHRLTEVIVMVSMVLYLYKAIAARKTIGDEGSTGPPPTLPCPANSIVVQCAPAVRTAMVIFVRRTQFTPIPSVNSTSHLSSALHAILNVLVLELFASIGLSCFHLLTDAAAAFFKLNTSFFDPHASCAPLFILQLVAAYLPDNVAPFALTDLLAWSAPLVAFVVELLIPLLLAQASRPALRRLGLCLGLLFHFLIALTPPPNNAGGFSVGAIVRYFFFFPVSTATAMSSLVGSSGRGLVLGSVSGAVVVAALQASQTLQGALPVFILLFILYAKAIALSLTTVSTSTRTSSPAAVGGGWAIQSRVASTANTSLLLLAFAYAFVFPVLGLQDMAACNMFANLHGPTAVVTGMNHFLVPTGLLQARYEHDSPKTNPFAGGVVQIVHSTSPSMRDLFPAEATSMLTPRTRAMLHHAGHSGREFSPSTTRVVGTLPGMKPHPDPKHEQLRYLLPAIELRRLLAEARSRSESFTLTYRRVSTTGAPFDGRTVTLVEKQSANAQRSSRCRAHSSNSSMMSIFGGPCDADEIALLPPSDWWLSGLLLAFPLPMATGMQRELGCIA